MNRSATNEAILGGNPRRPDNRRERRLRCDGGVRRTANRRVPEDKPAVTPIDESYQTARRVTRASIAVSGILACSNIIIGLLAQSTKFRVGRRIRSSALVADAWNDAVDILSALAALTAVGLATYDPGRFLAADHYGGFAVGIVVVVTGLRVLRDASLELADTMPPTELTGEIQKLARSVAGVQGIDKVFARKSGLQYLVDLHIEVDPTLTVAASHAIAGHVRAILKRTLSWVADVMVHVEPSPGTEEPASSASCETT